MSERHKGPENRYQQLGVRKKSQLLTVRLKNIECLDLKLAEGCKSENEFE